MHRSESGQNKFLTSAKFDPLASGGQRGPTGSDDVTLQYSIPDNRINNPLSAFEWINHFAVQLKQILYLHPRLGNRRLLVLFWLVGASGSRGRSLRFRPHVAAAAGAVPGVLPGSADPSRFVCPHRPPPPPPSVVPLGCPSPLLRHFPTQRSAASTGSPRWMWTSSSAAALPTPLPPTAAVLLH